MKINCNLFIHQKQKGHDITKMKRTDRNQRIFDIKTCFVFSLLGAVVLYINCTLLNPATH